MELIRLEDIRKTYYLGEIDVPVLKGVSFSIQKGEMVALMGASGSGKSTLMNILGCLDRPTSGKYWLDGREVGNLSANERALVRTSKLGFVFQSFNLLSRTTAISNVLMPLDYAENTPSMGAAHQRAWELLVRVGLRDRLHHVPSQMSGGQQQRVAIARGLINKPALILADEPTGNLDSHTSVEILEMFQQLNAEGITVLLVTHDPKVATYAHRTIRVADGLIEEDTSSPNNGSSLAGHGSPRPHLLTSNGHRAAGGRAATFPGNGVSEESIAPKAGSVATQVLPTPRETVLPDPAPTASTLGFESPTASAEEGAVHHGGLMASVLPPSIRSAIHALQRNKMRSALTTLGVIIGVAAVISMLEIGQGSRAALMRSISSMGANILIIHPGAASSGGVSFGRGSIKTLTPQDADEIGRQCSAVSYVSPFVQTRSQVVYGNRNWVPMEICGVNASFGIIRDWEDLDEGAWFTENDVRSGAQVCLLGKTVSESLFDQESPIGREVRINNVGLRIIGVLSRKGANLVGRDQDDVVYTPWTTLKYRVSGAKSNAAPAAGATAGATGSGGTATDANRRSKLYPGGKPLYLEPSPIQAANNPQPVRFANVDEIMVKVASTPQIPEAIEQVTNLLRQRHRIRPDEGDEDDFNVRDMTEIRKMMGSTSEMMGGLLLIVALISLAVGGIGIMNIMLVSVTERTREIGLRMAVGARSFHILRQFLIEAVVLCLLGGVVGILLGRGVSLTVWYFLRWPIQISVVAIVAACAVSIGIGVGFGFYPAWKASRLDPIEALRYE